MDEASQKDFRSHNIDSKKVKRAMTSKEYSRNHRVKQFEYLAKLEKQMKFLQAEVIVQSPRIKYFEEQNLLLQAQNATIKEQLSACTAQLMFKEAEYIKLKKESEAMKIFLRGCLQQNPQLLENLHPMTTHLVHFMLNQSLPLDHGKTSDDHHDHDQMPSCGDTTVESGAGESSHEHEPYRFLN